MFVSLGWLLGRLAVNGGRDRVGDFAAVVGAPVRRIDDEWQWV
jgi:hypothetical protein